jgi:hypothetical protein
MTKTKQLTLTERLAQIEAEMKEWDERCARLIAACKERDLRVTTLLGL